MLNVKFWSFFFRFQILNQTAKGGKGLVAAWSHSFSLPFLVSLPSPSPSILQGNPFIFKGHPFVFKGNPSIFHGNPFNSYGNTFNFYGNPLICYGNPFIFKGNSFIFKGSPIQINLCWANESAWPQR